MASEWEKPSRPPERDIASVDLFESIAQASHGALIAFAGSSLGQAQLPSGLKLREALDRHADHQKGVWAEYLAQVA